MKEIRVNVFGFGPCAAHTEPDSGADWRLILDRSAQMGSSYGGQALQWRCAAEEYFSTFAGVQETRAAESESNSRAFSGDGFAERPKTADSQRAVIA